MRCLQIVAFLDGRMFRMFHFMARRMNVRSQILSNYNMRTNRLTMSRSDCNVFATVLATLLSHK